MPVGPLLLVLLLAGGGLLAWIYLRKELAVPGRPFLAAVRIAALLVIVLLLWNPRISFTRPQGARPWLLVDGSLSMVARGMDGSSAWSRALERAEEEDWGRILVFGDQVRPVAPDSLVGVEPTARRSRLGPALTRAAEAGARGVVVLTDGRLEDGVPTLGEGTRTPPDARFELVGGEVRNAGVAELILPRTVDEGSPVPVEAVVFGAVPSAPDSADVEIREEGRLRASRRVALPAAGRLARIELELPPPEGPGFRRYEARAVLDGDGFPPDDVRAAYLEVDAPERGVVLVSFRPDWEPRFLLPVLARVTGLPAEGFLTLRDGRFLTLPEPGDEVRVVGGDLVRERAVRADVLVLHGAGAALPDWVRPVVTGARRLLVFAADPDGAALVGLDAGPALPGEWYPAVPLPPSPLAQELAGVRMEGLPPLGGVLGAGDGAGLGPIPVRRGGTGPGAPSLLLTPGPAGGRRVVVLASGFWRWAFRSDPGREAYRRLWSGVAGWLLGGEPLADGPGVRLRRRVLDPGEEVRWTVAGLEESSIRMEVRRNDTLVVDSVMEAVAGGLRLPPLPEGRYAFRATSGRATDAPVLGRGPFEVEPFTEELLIPRTEPGGDRRVEGGSGGEEREGRPLRTHPLPYLLVLALLCGEWIARRRAGLR